MTTAEPSAPDAPGADPGATEAWLRGLAGQGAASSADAFPADHAEGTRLRRALDAIPSADAAAADWADVQARAALRLQTVADPVAALQPPRLSPAANRRHGWRTWSAFGAVASVALVAVVMVPSVWQRSAAWDADEERGWRGESSQPTWLSPQPEQDAAALAAELQAWGAQVRVLPVQVGQGPASSPVSPASAEGLRLDIRCATPCDERVHQRLQSLETGLDGRGELSLWVKAAN